MVVARKKALKLHSINKEDLMLTINISDFMMVNRDRLEEARGNPLWSPLTKLKFDSWPLFGQKIEFHFVAQLKIIIRH
jgi:hypothetical protein